MFCLRLTLWLKWFGSFKEKVIVWTHVESCVYLKPAESCTTENVPKLTIGCHILLEALSFNLPFLKGTFSILNVLYNFFFAQTSVWKPVNEFHMYYSLYFHILLKSWSIRFHRTVKALEGLQSTLETSITLIKRINRFSIEGQSDPAIFNLIWTTHPNIFPPIQHHLNCLTYQRQNNGRSKTM